MSHGIYSGILWLAFYLVIHYQGITPSSVRQMILSSTTDVVDTSKLWDVTDVDCGSANLSHDIFRRSVHDNINIACFQKIAIEFQKVPTFNIVFLAEYTVSTNLNLSKFDLFADLIPSIYIPSDGISLLVNQTPVIDSSITTYTSKLEFDLLISSADYTTFYAGITNRRNRRQFLSSENSGGIDMKGFLFNGSVYKDHIMGSGVISSDYIKIYAVTRDDHSCIYTNTDVQDKCTEPSVFTQSSKFNLTVGEPVDLHCSYDDSFPMVIRVIWLQDWNSLNSTSVNKIWTGTDFSLRITNATIYDLGKYQCAAVTLIFWEYATIIIEAAPFVTTSMIEGFIGQPLTFCRIYTYPTDFAVRVFKFETGVEQIIDSIESYSKRNITFDIHHAEFSNTGNYTCTATNSVGATTSDPFEVFIYGVVISTSVVSHSIIFGENITIDCHVQSLPELYDLKWIFNGSGINSWANLIFNEVENNHTLFVLAATFDNEGYYECFANNSKSSESSDSIYIDIIGGVPTVITNQPIVSADYLDKVMLTCDFNAFPNATSLYWTRRINGAETAITANAHGGDLTSPYLVFDHVQGSDRGNYSCHVVNAVGNTTGGVIHLKIDTCVPTVITNQPIVSADYLDKVMLTCDFNAFPNATSLYWTRRINGAETAITANAHGGDLTSPYLVFDHVQGSDRGNYSCHVVNAVGNTTGGVIHLKIDTYIPVVTSNHQSRVNINESASITLNCTVDASPEISYLHWTRTVKGVEFNISVNAEGGTITSPNLQFDKVKWTDTGSYTCHVGNEIGNVTGNAIDIQVDTGTPMCPCTNEYLHKLLLIGYHTLTNHTREELLIIMQPILKKLTEELKIDKKQVSSYRRTLISVPDKRGSAKGIGYFGIVFLVGTFGLIVCLDILCIKQHLNNVRIIWNGGRYNI